MNESDRHLEDSSHLAFPDRAGPACPSDLDLSRFIDGALDSASRTAMLEHLERCDDCREVVATVVQSQSAMAAQADPSPSPAPIPLVHDASAEQTARRTWITRVPAWTWAAAAAAIVLAVRMSGPAVAPDPTFADVPDPWAAIARTVGAARTMEARLSMLPDHVPLASPTRAATSPDARFEIQSLAARLGQSAASASGDAVRRTTVRHAAAVAALLAGRTDEAARELESAATETTEAAALSKLLSDLSAAHAARGDWQGAWTSAREALVRDATNAAARFNEALALERLGRLDEAETAWRAIAVDSTHDRAWRDEALRHLRTPTP